MLFKIAIVVHGRFYAFDLARELLRRGHEVTLFTNYPRLVAERFGIPHQKVRSFVAHGVASRVLWRLLPARFGGGIERVSNMAFGRWAADNLTREAWDIVLAFSGVAEETFQALGKGGTLKCLARASSHIREQWRLLNEEQARAGTWVEKPSAWIMAREEREYTQADLIQVVSTFAHQSFERSGVAAERLHQLRLGVDTKVFRASPEVVEARCRRILDGAPLRVLSVGTFSHRKGAGDFVNAMRLLGKRRFSFRFVGPIAQDARALRRESSPWATFVPKQPQDELPREYQWGDVFVLPTLEDGFPVVLTQALASGLPLISTPNCSAPDLIRSGEGGWIIPVRSPEALSERLRWCDVHRSELVRMVQHVHRNSPCRDWSDTALQAEQSFTAALVRKRGWLQAECALV